MERREAPAVLATGPRQDGRTGAPLGAPSPRTHVGFTRYALVKSAGREKGKTAYPGPVKNTGAVAWLFDNFIRRACRPGAAKKSPPRTGLTAIQFECFKQQGAFYDAETRRWKMTCTDNNMLSRMEAVNTCVMQKTGKRPEPFLREERIYH